MILFIIITVYILSFMKIYFWLRAVYSEKGAWEISKPGITDIALTIFPLVNTIAAIIFSFESPVHKKYRKETKWGWFFGLNK